MTYDPANPNNKPNPFRNLRPEMDPANTKHAAFALLPEAYDDVRQRCINFNALHRLAFVVAAMEHKGIFIDVRQEDAASPVPYLERQGEVVFCAIVGDRTIHAEGAPRPSSVPPGAVAVSLGPDGYHQQSLKALFKQADVISIDCTGTGNAAIYMAACSSTALYGKNSILIETNADRAMAWTHFVNEFAGHVKKTLIDDEATALVALETEQPEIGSTLN